MGGGRHGHTLLTKPTLNIGFSKHSLRYFAPQSGTVDTPADILFSDSDYGLKSRVNL